MFASILLLIIPLFINVGVCGYIIYTNFPFVTAELIAFSVFAAIFTLAGFIGFFKSGKKFFTLLPWLGTAALIYIFRRDIAEVVENLIVAVGSFYEVENSILN